QELAKTFGVPVLSLARRFRQDFQRRLTKRVSARRASPRWIYTQGDGIHPSLLGNELGAKFIAQALLGNGGHPPVLPLLRERDAHREGGTESGAGTPTHDGARVKLHQLLRD